MESDAEGSGSAADSQAHYANVFSSSISKSPGAVNDQLKERQKSKLRDSLSFHDMCARLENISVAQLGTCDWFFETPIFQKWYEREDDDNGLLWIKGKPGTGKSTLVRHILRHCQTREDYTIAAYFFNARGAELEKTPLGMLRSLLFQLLEHEPSLYDKLLPMYRQNEKDYKKEQGHKKEHWEWHELDLKSVLLSEVPKCRSKPLLLIIDALDECNDSDVQKVANFLQDLNTNATNAGVTLNICLSSRHYPFIQFKKHQELVLEEEKHHDEDIIQYISSNLIKRNEEIEEAIREKSAGIFMWVVLVVAVVNNEYGKGKIEAMKQKLNEMPAELENVFEAMLHRGNDTMHETILILQCVLFAKRLLKPEEIYYALIAGTNSHALGAWDPSQITPDDIRRRITSSSRGLVEIRKGKRETVQFVHESVNDFLVRNKRLQSLDMALKHDPIGKSHDRLRECCMSYLMMESLELPNNEEVDNTFASIDYASDDASSRGHTSDNASSRGHTSDNASSRRLTLDNASSLRHAFDDTSSSGYTSSSTSSFQYSSKFPFFEYASEYIFDHAEEATFEGQTEMIRVLKDEDIFKRLQCFHNYFAYNNAHGEPLSLLHLLAARGLPKMIGILLDGGVDVNAKGRPHGTALKAAVFCEHKSTVKILLDKGAKADSGNLIGKSTLKLAFDTGSREIPVMLVEKGAKFNIWETLLRGSMLHEAVDRSDKDAIAMMLKKGAKISTRGPFGGVLSASTSRGHLADMHMLLEKGAKINSRGFLGTALMAAAVNGQLEVVKVLLKKGAKVNSRGLLGNSFSAALAGGETEIVKMLLEKGVETHVQGIWGPPLVIASFKADIETVKMLLEKRANVNDRGLLGTAIVAAAYRQNTRVAEMLLERGAEINARGIMGTALVVAALRENIKMVRMLLERGAEIDARGIMGTALVVAALRENIKMVRMLLEKGAEINARGIMGTALVVAALHGQPEMAKMLIEKGAEINARGISGTALVAAAYKGNTEIIEMLLEKGADVNAGGGLLGNALHSAVVAGHTEIVEILVDKGARVNVRAIIGHRLFNRMFSYWEIGIPEMLPRQGARMLPWGKVYGTALQVAELLGRENIKRLLLDRGAKQ